MMTPEDRATRILIEAPRMNIAHFLPPDSPDAFAVFTFPMYIRDFVADEIKAAISEAAPRWARIGQGLPDISEEHSQPGLTRTIVVIWQTKLQGSMFPGYAWWTDEDPGTVRVSTDTWNVVYTLDELVGWYPLPPPLENQS